MATATLIPSHYWRSSSTYVSVSNADNMYTDISSSTYATLTSTRAATTAYYVFINGFNISSVPVGATVDSFVVKIRGYRNSRISTNASYRPCLTNTTNGTVFADTTADTTFGTSETTIVIPTGSLTWSDLVSDGANFSIRVSVTRSSSSYQGYLYIYGAEIDVTYTEAPTPAGLDNVYVKQNGLWVAANKMLVKQNGVWNEASKVLAKDNGTWK